MARTKAHVKRAISTESSTLVPELKIVGVIWKVSAKAWASGYSPVKLYLLFPRGSTCLHLFYLDAAVILVNPTGLRLMEVEVAFATCFLSARLLSIPVHLMQHARGLPILLQPKC